MKSHRFLPVVFFILLIADVRSQPNGFNYRRKITVAANGWGSVTLPPDIFRHAENDLRDLRILSFSGSDTVEIPFLIRKRETTISSAELSLPEVNRSKKDGSLFVSFELPSSQQINSLELEFEPSNFFASVRLEGSDNKNDWFEIVNDQKIFSIHNPNEHYRYTTVNFPVSNYRHLRIRMTSQTSLPYLRTTFRARETKQGKFRKIPLTWNARNLKKEKQSWVDINFDHYQPVSEIEITAEDGKDFYRHFVIEKLSDSTKTEKGWIKNYHTIREGYLTSFTERRFAFDYQLVKSMRLKIDNWDNAPLTLKQIEAQSPIVELVAEMALGENYLYYGNDRMMSPTYDLPFFEKKVPSVLPESVVGVEENLALPAPKRNALFANKAWLWSIMVIAIAVLGYFTVKMMKMKEATP